MSFFEKGLERLNNGSTPPSQPSRHGATSLTIPLATTSLAATRDAAMVLVGVVGAATADSPVVAGQQRRWRQQRQPISARAENIVRR